MNLLHKVNILVFIVLTLFLVDCKDNSISVYTIAKSNITKTNDTNFKFALPKGWLQKDSTGIRALSFSVQGADVSVIVFGGDGGGLEPNVNRWRKQISLNARSSKQIKKDAQNLRGKLGKFYYFELENHNNQQAIFATIYFKQDKVIFIKIKGELNIVKNNKTKFLRFCKNIYEK